MQFNQRLLHFEHMTSEMYVTASGFYQINYSMLYNVNIHFVYYLIKFQTNSFISDLCYCFHPYIGYNAISTMAG